MFRKIFTLSNGALLVALSLSTIAAWYSIIGLTAIFAGAVVPIIIMGTALEFAKITTTVWLRKYWHRCSMIMKIYLVPAVVLLALLTSMGIFGFLSKAHLDQNIGSGDVQAQVSLLDEKIATQRENVRSSKAMLAQMDQQVNDIMTKGDSERAVERSVAIRKQQAKERASLQKDIEIANKEIQKLNEERAPIASELRKVEAEVGPIKYIAALIYGDNPDANILERAVRWVIILLVVVFDPLAIMLVLAANQSKDWDNHIEEELKLKEKVEHEKVMEEIQPVYVADVTMPEPEDLTAINHELQEAAVVEEPFIEEPEVVVDDTRTMAEKHPYLEQPFKHFENTTPLVATKEEPVVEEVDTFEETRKEVEDNGILAFGVDVVERPGDYVTQPEENVPFEGVKVNGEWVQTGPTFVEEVDTDNVPEISVIKGSDYILYNGTKMHKNAFKANHPELALEVDNPRAPRTGFGVDFPLAPHIGDTFVRVDAYPNRTYKFNGVRWIETNRSNTDTYLGNTEYLQFLVEKIATGEYDPEQLTDQEEEAVREYLGNK